LLLRRAFCETETFPLLVLRGDRCAPLRPEGKRQRTEARDDPQGGLRSVATVREPIRRKVRA